MAAGARAALRALLALLCCGAPRAVGGVALRPRAGPGDVKVPRVRLPGGGGAMPMAGLGLPKCEPDAAVGGDCREKARNATLEFLLLGGRLLDTALAYENHRAVGAAIREAVDRHGVRREDIFVSSKINPDWFGTGNVTRAVRRTLDELGLEYVDQLLLHHPGRAGRAPAQVMTYSVELFLSVIVGLAVGHKVAATVGRSQALDHGAGSPCCRLAAGLEASTDPRAVAAEPGPTGDAEGLVTVRLAVKGMTCGACVETVRRALAGVEGAHSATVSLQDASAEVLCKPSSTIAHRLCEACSCIGFDAQAANRRL